MANPTSEWNLLAKVSRGQKFNLIVLGDNRNQPTIIKNKCQYIILHVISRGAKKPGI
jgi:hypothetical protein